MYSHCFQALLLLFITVYGPTVQNGGEDGQGSQLRDNVRDAAAFQVDHAHDFHEVTQGIGVSDVLCPSRHAADRGK